MRVRVLLGPHHAVKCNRVAYCMLASQLYANLYSIFNVAIRRLLSNRWAVVR